MYRLLVTLIRKLCAIVRPILNWSSHSSVARLLSRLWSFVLRRSRLLTSKLPLDDVGVPTPAILLPSAAASTTSITRVRSMREIEEGLPGPAVDPNSTEEPPQADLSPRAVEHDDDNEHGLLPPESRAPFATSFLPMLPEQSGRYDQNIIMCVR